MIPSKASNKRTVMILDNEYGPDLRVKREMEVLTGAGWDVRLVAWDREARRPLDVCGRIAG